MGFASSYTNEQRTSH